MLVDDHLLEQLRPGEELLHGVSREGSQEGEMYSSDPSGRLQYSQSWVKSATVR